MNAKLIKVLDQYHLYEDDKPIATTIVCNPMLLPILSIKNCEAIANGYDLDELLDTLLIGRGEHQSRVRNPLYGEERQLAKDLVQKTLELLGDKKFSEGDMKNCWETALQVGRFEEKGIAEKGFSTVEDHIYMLQQTEWKVEIVTKPYTEVGEGFNLESKREPKLDEDGCLILKRL